MPCTFSLDFRRFSCTHIVAAEKNQNISALFCTEPQLVFSGEDNLRSGTKLCPTNAGIDTN